VISSSFQKPVFWVALDFSKEDFAFRKFALRPSADGQGGKSNFWCAKSAFVPQRQKPTGQYLKDIEFSFKIWITWVVLRSFKEHLMFREYGLRMSQKLKAKNSISGPSIMSNRFLGSSKMVPH
jgi:hypothetical protein